MQAAKSTQSIHITPIYLFSSLHANTMVPKMLQNNVNHPPESPSDKGQVNSAVYSKNTGVNEKTQHDPPIVETHTCQ